jgi:hypothetical protein
LVRKSRWLILFWGLALTGFTQLLNLVRADIPILPLAFGMTTYTMGPLLGLLLCALVGRGSVRGLVIGSVISVLLVAVVRVDFWVLWIKAGLPFEGMAKLPTLAMNATGDGLTPVFCFAWAWPVTTAITFCCGYFMKKRDSSNAHPAPAKAPLG